MPKPFNTHTPVVSVSQTPWKTSTRLAINRRRNQCLFDVARRRRHLGRSIVSFSSVVSRQPRRMSRNSSRRTVRAKGCNSVCVACRQVIRD